VRASIIKPLSSLILRFPRANLIITALITLFFCYQLFHMEFDTSLSAFVIKDDPDLAYYNKIKEIFETDETVVIGFKARNLFGKNDLEFIDRLSKEIGQIDSVRNVRSLTTANFTASTPDMFEVKALVEKMPENEEESAFIKEQAAQNYLYLKDLASTNGKYASLLVEIKNTSDKQHTKAVVTKLKKLLKEEERRSGYNLYLGGDAIIHDSLGEYMRADFFIFIIPIYLLMTFLIRITMGRWRDTIAALITVSLSLIWSMGTIPLLKKTFNNVTIGIIPLIFCIALENIYFIHDMYYDRLRAGRDKKEAMKETLASIFRPVYYTSLTTVIGFTSLMINNIKPMFEFGLLGSVASILAFFISIVFIPSFHLLLPTPKDLDKKLSFKLNALPLIKRLTAFVEKRAKWFWVGIPLVIIISVLGIMRIRVETDYLTFFKKNSEVYRSTMFIEKNLAGVSNLEVIVNTNINGGVKNPANLSQIDKLAQFLRSQKEVDKAMSIVDFLKDMNRAMHDNDQAYYRIPDSQEEAAQYLLMYSMSSRRNDIEKDFVDYPYSLARIRCRISEHNSRKLLDLISRIKKFTKENIDPVLEVRMSSYPVIYSNMVNSITAGQTKGFLFCIFTLWITAAFYFRSIPIGTLTLIPNLIPIIFIFGFMGWTGISLNIGTALTTGIALGLIMDDTTHFFNRFKINLTSCPDYLENMRKTYALIGEPMIYSSCVMTASYLVLAFSQFHLTALFGFLCALTTIIALWCDLLLTPWLLITFKMKLK